MELVWAIFWFAVGILIIVKGGNLFVDAARWMSDVTGIPKIVIGATIVAFATTAPEYFVSLFASIKGQTGMAVGNAVGSLACNIGIALGMFMWFGKNKTLNDSTFTAKSTLMMAAAALLGIFVIDGKVGVVDSLFLLMIFIAFTYVCIFKSAQRHEVTKKVATDKKDITKHVLMFIIGAIGVLIGSDLLVDNATILAQVMGVSDTVIGLTVVAIGTSLPEIVTAIISLVKKEGNLSMDNILGANVIDTTLILPSCALFSGTGLTVAAQTYMLDIPVVLILMAITIIPPILTKKFYKWQGISVMAIYFSYIAYVAFF